MQAILAVTAPFFALILAGYLAARRGLLPLSAIGGLNAYVLYFALPCMLLRFGMNTPLAALFDPVIMGLYTLVAVVVVALAFLMAQRWRASPRNAAFAALVATFPNSGFIGVPLLVALLGAASAGPVICTLLVDIFLTTSACLALAQRGGTGQADPWRSLRESLVAPLRNPLPWSIALGALASGLEWRLQGPVDTVVRMLGDSASPVALFTIGAVLYRSQASGSGVRPCRFVSGIVALKLILHPALVLLAAWGARRAGAQLDDLQIAAITLVSALPSASNVSLLAERWQADSGLVARIILWSTVLAFGSFSLWAWSFGVQGAG